MIFTLDTNACVAHLRRRGVSAVSRRLAAVSVSDVVISSIVRAELLYGALRSRDVARNTAEVNAFLSRFASVPFDDAAAIQYAGIRHALAGLGLPIGPNALLIAAIALANDLTVMTHNTSEFSRVPGLKMEDWEIAP